MESDCVRVPILPATIEGLLRLLESSHVTLCPSALLHSLICHIITYEDYLDKHQFDFMYICQHLFCFFFLLCKNESHLERESYVKLFLIK